MIVPILLYHSITGKSTPKFEPWTVTPEHFDEQMRYLSGQGYTSLTVTQLTDLVTGKNSEVPERPLVITFDDGFADFESQALPILTRYGLSATIYIITAYVMGTSRWLAAEGSGDMPMLTWDQIGAIAGRNVEIGAHSHTHPQLDTLPIAMAEEEICISKSILETHLGRQIQSFAYPHGYHGPQVRRLVQEAGFSSAVAVKQAMSSLQDDQFAFSRIIIYHDRTLEQFRQLLSGNSLPVAPRGERVQTRLWRLYRQTRARLKGTKLEQPIGSSR